MRPIRFLNSKPSSASEKTGDSISFDELQAGRLAAEQRRAAKLALDSMNHFAAAARENCQTGMGAIMDKWAAKYGARAVTLAAESRTRRLR